MVGRASTEQHEPGLGFTDTVSIIVGIVIGTGIFVSAPHVLQHAGGPFAGLALWFVGGALSLCGALCYAELATTFPRNGGDYEYLTRAYGRWVGFLFGWAQLTVILSGSIGSMAYAFADYGSGLFPPTISRVPWLAVGAVLVLTAMNLMGVAAGKSSQNLLTVAKVLGLSIIMVAGLVAVAQQQAAPFADVPPTSTSGWGGLGLALVFVMYTYGGWNDAAFVAAEVRDVRRNLPRALFAGLAIVTSVYVLVNLVYLLVLGYTGASQSLTPAADVTRHSMGPAADGVVRVIVMISALGAINGLILTGSRVYAVFGQDNAALRALGRWNLSAQAPTMALIVQAVLAIGMILLVGTDRGQAAADGVLQAAGLNGLPWDTYFGGFETLVAGTAPTFWLFFLLTGIAVFVLRWRTPAEAYQFRIPLYPVPPVLFCASCAFMLYQSLSYARWLALIGILPLMVGIPFGFFHRRRVAPLA